MDKKELLIEAMQKNLGMITYAAKKCKVSIQSYYNWKENDPEFKAAIDNIKLQKCDFVESKLMGLIRDGNPAAIIFAAKCLLKDRGYAERVEHVHKGSGSSGEIIFKADYGSDDSEV